MMSKPTKSVRKGKKKKALVSESVPFYVPKGFKRLIERALSIDVTEIDYHVDLEKKQMHTKIQFEGDPSVSAILPEVAKAILEGSSVQDVIDDRFYQSPVISEFRKLIKKRPYSDEWRRKLRFWYEKTKTPAGKEIDVLYVSKLLPDYNWDLFNFFGEFRYSPTNGTYDRDLRRWRIENIFKPSALNKLCKGLGFFPKIEKVDTSYLESKVKKTINTYYKK